MGHLEDQKYSDMYDFFIRGDISEKEFLKWYRTANNSLYIGDIKGNRRSWYILVIKTNNSKEQSNDKEN